MIIAIVGNAPIDTDMSENIDSADMVVRMNLCASFNGNTGSKTDIIALTNTGEPAIGFTRNQTESFWQASRASRTVLLCRSALGSFLNRTVYHRGEMAPCFVDHSSLLKRHYKLRQKAVLNASFSDDISLSSLLKPLQPEPFLMPSTGACVVNYFLRRKQPSDVLRIFGFAHYGWPHHPWNAERKWLSILKERPDIEFYPC